MEEAARLDQIQEALWEAFLAAPENGINPALIELANAYNSTLRLKLTMRSYNSAPIRTARVIGAKAKP